MPEQNHEGRTVLVTKISEQLAQLTASVTIDVKNNLSTRNVLAENMLAGLLNRMQGWQLINANRIRYNYPAVDLVDTENRIAIQVTSTNGAEKIKHTLKEFEKHNLDNDYDRLYVVIITTDKPTPSMRSKSIPGIFSGETDIWNIPTLEGKLMDLPVTILEGIHSYLTEELGKLDGSRPYLYLPPDSALGDGFVGREAELSSIRNQIDQGLKPVVLSGLGGMGKTELAARFGRLYADGDVYFIRFQASFTATITGLYGKIIPAPMQPPSEKEQLESVIKLLNRCTEKDLLIFDNVDANSGDLSDLMRDEVYKKLRQLRPRIILTTRFDWDRAIPVHPLPDEKLKEIFLTHGAVLEDQQMIDLIEAVNGHTMTIDLMARTLNGKGWRKVTAEDMLRAIRENTLPSEKYRKIATDYNQAQEQAQIYQHLSVVFDLSGVPENGQNVLRCATLLPEGGMDGGTFGYSLPEDQQEALDELLNHGWLSMENGLLRIHPIVRLVCREELKPSDESCGDFLNALWSQYDTKKYDNTLYSQMANTFSTAADHLEDKYARWINHAGFLLGVLVQPLQAKNLYEKHIPTLMVRFSNQQTLATVFNNLGAIYQQLGDHRKEQEYLLKAVALYEKVLPADDPIIALSYNNLGVSYSALGDHNNALHYKLRALKLSEKTLSSDHPNLAQAYNNVGITYGILGDHKKAINYLLKALNIWSTVLPADHPELATSYSNIAVTYSELGDHKMALEYLFKGLAVNEKILPNNHPSLVLYYNNLASSYGRLGDYKSAMQYNLMALEVAKKSLPDNHPNLAIVYGNLGMNYGKLGDHKKALQYAQKNLVLFEHSLPADHPNLAIAFNNLAQVYFSLRDYPQAQIYIIRAVEIQEKVLPSDHPNLAYSYNNLGCTYGMQGQYEMAILYLKKSLKIREKKLHPGHPHTEDTRKFIQFFQKKQQMQQNMANAGFNFDTPFGSPIPPKK